MPHSPSQKQALFLGLTCEEALYGGAGGGGKSDALLMAALQYVDVPGYSAIIFRRTKTDLNLANAVLDRARTWWSGTLAQWDSDLYGFRFPTLKDQPDATIAFAYMQTEADRLRYQGAEFQFIGFDELTQFSQLQYTYMFSRLRRTKGFQAPLRMRAASNPGGPGHDWVKERFVKYARELQQDHLMSPPSREVQAVAQEYGMRAEGAHFVRAFPLDNPGLDLPGYRMQLAKLDPVTRRQMEEGDWDAVPGGEYFKREWFRFLPVAPAGLRWMRYWDLAATRPHEGNPNPDWTAGVKMALEREPDGSSRVVIADVRRTRESPGEVEKLIKTTAHTDGRLVAVRIEEEPGSAGKNNSSNYKNRVLFGWDIEGHKKTGDKDSFWRPLAAQAEAGNLYLVEGAWNEDFIHELASLPTGKKDQADAAAGCFDRLLENNPAGRTLMMLSRA